jgi:hypothetical protein
MFAPTQQDVRLFFCEVYRKNLNHLPMTPLEILAADWVTQHPEYHPDLTNQEAALSAVFDVATGRTNPFLHLSMHLSITEQVSIDQPPGIRAACERLASKLGSLHEAHHEVMECLGEMMWASQKSGLSPDGETYIASVNRRATRF